MERGKGGDYVKLKDAKAMIEAIQEPEGNADSLTFPLRGTPPTNVPIPSLIGQRKVLEKVSQGFIINGLAMINPLTRERCLVDYLGSVAYVAEDNEGR
jgi:hypothetical protein